MARVSESGHVASTTCGGLRSSQANGNIDGRQTLHRHGVMMTGKCSSEMETLWQADTPQTWSDDDRQMLIRDANIEGRQRSIEMECWQQATLHRGSLLVLSTGVAVLCCRHRERPKAHPSHAQPRG